MTFARTTPAFERSPRLFGEQSADRSYSTAEMGPFVLSLPSHVPFHTQRTTPQPGHALSDHNQRKSLIHYRTFRPWHPLRPNNKEKQSISPYVWPKFGTYMPLIATCAVSPGPVLATIQMDSSQYPFRYCFARAVPWRATPDACPCGSFFCRK